jgi:3-dehydrosphinganine reductase
MDYFRGKKVFITGGSAGIGKATAVQLARAGAEVFIAARGQAQLDQALKEIREVASTDQRTGAVSLDVTDRAAVRGAARDVIDGLGGLDVLVCNSGYAHTGWVHEMPDSAFDDMIQVNYMGHVNVTRALLPHLMSQGSGDICLVSSMLGFFGAFGYTAYSASKYAVRGFAESLRHELLPHGIRVSLLYPPTTQTPGLDKENEGKPKAVWTYESDSGFNKIYEAEAVADAILKSIQRGSFENVVGLDSWFMRWMFRHFPRISRWMNDGELKKAFKKVEGAKQLPG